MGSFVFLSLILKIGGLEIGLRNYHSIKAVLLKYPYLRQNRA